MQEVTHEMFRLNDGQFRVIVYRGGSFVDHRDFKYKGDAEGFIGDLYPVPND